MRPVAAPPTVPLSTRYKMENSVGSGKQWQNYIYLLSRLVEKEYTVMGQHKIIHYLLKIGLPARAVKCESRNVNLVVRVGLETKKYAGLRYDVVYHMKAL